MAAGGQGGAQPVTHHGSETDFELLTFPSAIGDSEAAGNFEQQAAGQTPASTARHSASRQRRRATRDSCLWHGSS